MLRSFVRNVAISAVAFFAVSLVGLLLVPLLIRHYGIAGFGYISVARLFLPVAALGLFDFGLGEIATQSIGRARADGDWVRCGRALGLSFGLAAGIGLLVGLGLALLTPWLGHWMRVPDDSLVPFRHLMWVTSALLPLFFVSLAFEGVIKGFERYVALRSLEVSSSLFYAALVLCAVSLSWDATAVCYALLLSQTVRALCSAMLAINSLRPYKVRLARALSEERRHFRVQTQGMAFNKVLGTIQTQLTPLLIGLMFGPTGVGTFDALSRLPRAVKAVLGLISSTILPIASRLESAADTKNMRRLGQIGVLMIGLVAIPPLGATMSFSEPLLATWVGAGFAALAGWQAAMFVIPALSVLLSFGGTALLVRPHVVAKMNRLILAQLVLQFALSWLCASWLQERAFILGQVVAVSVTFIPQLLLICRELDVPRKTLGQLVIMLLVMLVLGLPAAWLAPMVHGWIPLILAMGAWTVLCWGACFMVVVAPHQRAQVFARVRPFFNRR